MPSRCPPLRSALFALPLLAAIQAQPAAAFDDRGAFAVHGQYGMMTCTQLRAVLDDAGAGLVAFASWVDGVLSGANMLMPGVFDVSPYPRRPLVQAMLIQRCNFNPEARVHAVLQQVLEVLLPYRVAEAGPGVTMKVNDQEMEIAQSALEEVQRRLIARGYLGATDLDGRYSLATRDALLAFQKDNGLPQTELPDPETLEFLGRAP